MAVVIVCYNGGSDVVECVRSLRQHPPGQEIELRIIIVDNASADGSPGRIEDEFPHVHLLRSANNLGFAGGNNLGWDYIRERYPQTRYLMLLNQDTLVGPDWLGPLVEFMETNPASGAVQPLIMLYPETDLINTAGNRCHYLGFTFITRYRERPQADEPIREIDAVSGAACLVRCDRIHELGLFDAAMFMYCEDVDLSWKLRITGNTLHTVPQSRVYHRYEFKSPKTAYFYLERNRWWLLLTYYRWRTLLLLGPALFAMEAALWMHALATSQAASRICIFRSLVTPATRVVLARLRKQLQAARKLPDRRLLAPFTGVLRIPLLAGGPGAVLNILPAVYWWSARRLIRW